MATSSSEQLWSDRKLAVTVEEIDGARRTIRVAKPYARLGSHDRAEVVVTGADISPCHLYLHATDEGIYCLGLAGSATTGWLDTERSIKVGRYRITAAFDEDGPPLRAPDHNPAAKDSIASPLPRLRVRLTGDKKHAFELNLRRQLTVMGRQTPSTLCVHHSTVSRTHAVLFWDGQSLWVVDLLGANGIRRDGESLTAGLLAPSQRIALGDVRCRYLGPQPNVAEAGEARESGDESHDAEPVGTDRDAELAEAAHEIFRLQQELAAATSARELAEDTAADDKRRLDELAADHAALRAEIEAVRLELAASQEAIIVHQTAGEQRIAALREALNEELHSAAAARELAEQTAAERATALAGASEDAQRLQAELLAVGAARDLAETAASQLEADLAAARQQLVAVRDQGTVLQAAGDEQLAALREELSEELSNAAAARDTAEKAAADRKLALDKAAEGVLRLESELAETQRLFAASQQEQSNQRIAADERIAALRQQLASDDASAKAAREAAEQAATERKLALDKAAENVLRLETELAETRRLLADNQQEQTSLRTAADERVAALREQLTREVAVAAAARENAEQVAAERDRAVAEATENVERLEDVLAARQRELASVRDEFAAFKANADEHVAAMCQSHQDEIERVTAALQASANESLAALEESMRQEIADLEDERDQTRQTMLARQAELADARKSIEQLQAELAATRNELLARRDENIEREALTDEQLEATAAASLSYAAPIAAAQVVAPPTFAEPQFAAEPEAAIESESDANALPTEEHQWVLDDRVIGRLLDFRAKRESGRRRKLLWAAAACLAIICLGAAAAASRAWSARRQPADAPAASSDVDKLIREALIEPGLR